MVLIHTVYTMVSWLNTFPNKMSEKQLFLPRELVTVLPKQYYKAVVGTYVEISIYVDVTNKKRGTQTKLRIFRPIRK